MADHEPEQHFNIIDDSEVLCNDDWYARRAILAANSQQIDNVDIRALVLNCLCCERRTNCLLFSVSLDLAIRIVTEYELYFTFYTSIYWIVCYRCRSRIIGLSKQQRKDFLREQVRACVVKTNPSGILTMKYVVRSQIGSIACCEKAFYIVWGIKWHMMKTLRQVNHTSLIVNFNVLFKLTLFMIIRRK
jgi:hypothetical protein